jgi:hypothetical protein
MSMLYLLSCADGSIRTVETRNDPAAHIEDLQPRIGDHSATVVQGGQPILVGYERRRVDLLQEELFRPSEFRVYLLCFLGQGFRAAAMAFQAGFCGD